MKARHRSALALAVLATGFIVGAPADVSAQGGVNRAPPPDVPRIMVAALRGSEKNVGVQAADAIRSRLNQDIPFKQLYVLPKTDIVAMLEASGYNPNEPLPPNDAKELAKLLRADEYLEGTVTKGAGGFRIESRLVLARDNSLVQPLPPVEGARMDLVSKMLSTEVQNARKQLEAERGCVRLAREGKFKEAVVAAQAGIAAYPQATLARNCVMQAFMQLKYPGDSVLRIAQEILTIAPRFRPALGLAADAYLMKGDTARAVQTWTQLLATNPNDANLVERVVTNIAQLPGQASLAIPIIDTAVTENPGDTKLLDLQFRLKFVAKNWKGAVAAAEEIAKLDTAMMDTTYFQRVAAAQLSDSQPQKAAEVMARATQKFPQHASSQLFYSQMLRASGQLQQAIAPAQRAIALNPNIEGGVATIVQLQTDAKQLDSAMATIRAHGLAPAAQACAKSVADSSKADWQGRCKAVHANTVLLSSLALRSGNEAYKVFNGTKAPADFDAAIRWLALSDSVAGSDQAKFLQGATNVTMAQVLLTTEVQKNRSCDAARRANDLLVTAQPQVMAGGKFAPVPAGQLLTAIQGQLLPYAEQTTKAYCKG